MPAASHARITGSVFALARWFQAANYVNRPEDDLTRDEILNDLYSAERVAVQGDTVLVKTAHGACMIERQDDEGCKLVAFDYVENTRWTRTCFWMNASSVADLGDHLRSVERADFDALFFGATV